ncbi:MAG: hypothetical protein ACRD1R_12910, partial [Acidobacteriota bacterium]
LEAQVADAMIQAVARHGLRPASLEQLEQSGRMWVGGSANQIIAGGILRSDQRPTMAFYQWAERFPISVVMETGMMQPLDRRIQFHLWAVEAAISAFSLLVEDM